MSGDAPQIPAMTDLQSIMDTIPQNPQIGDYIGDISQLPTQVATNQRSNKKQKFIPEEDEALIRLYQQYGNDWKMISAVLKNRTPRQCRDRWKNYLSPEVSRMPWTPEDDALLYQKFKEFGRQWAIIAKCFPGRTDIHIKNRWVTISKQYMQNDQLIPQPPQIGQIPLNDQQQNQTPQPDANLQMM